MKKGHQSWEFYSSPTIISSGTVVGPDEGLGPLARHFDRIHGDLRLNQESWEKAERALLEEAATIAIGKVKLREEDVDFWIAGDLMNQIISSSFAARTLGIPYLGVFGACSTAMQSLALSGLLIESGAAKRILAGACSHRATAERQFRNPTEYGAQKPPTAQFTVTGAGVGLIVSSSDYDEIASRQPEIPPPIRVTGATIGRVVDMGVDDPYNMGAAMAPAAVDTIQAHLRDFGRTAEDYDVIFTGDLGNIGHIIAKELLNEQGVTFKSNAFMDCGMLIFDQQKQQVWSGGSGCGCVATTAYGYLLNEMRKGTWKRILVVATGALLSPVSYQQDETIPCIAHAVILEGGNV